MHPGPMATRPSPGRRFRVWQPQPTLVFRVFLLELLSRSGLKVVGLRSRCNAGLGILCLRFSGCRCKSQRVLMLHEELLE